MKLHNFKFKKFFTRFYTKAFIEEDIVSNAAQVAFYFAFALFPLLLFLVTLFGFVLESADDLRTEMFYYLAQVMPYSALDLVKETIKEVTENSSGGKLTFGILAALWAASAGIDSIRIVLNGVYNLTETRPWWKTKLISLSMTLGLGVLLTLALGVIFYGSKFVVLILNTLNLPIQSPIILGLLQWIIVGAVLLGIFALLYNFLPCHKDYKWVWVSPGAITSIVLWLLLSYGFKLYLGYFDSYNKTYGSLGAVIILMLWLYLTALVILIGGTVNAVLQEFTDPETAEAGANKAAAKEVVENPNAELEKKNLDAKKTETLNSLANATSEEPADFSMPENKKELRAKEKAVENYDISAEAIDSNKSGFKLAAGLLIGAIENLFSSKNKS